MLSTSIPSAESIIKRVVLVLSTALCYYVLHGCASHFEVRSIEEHPQVAGAKAEPQGEDSETLTQKKTEPRTLSKPLKSIHLKEAEIGVFDKLILLNNDRLLVSAQSRSGSVFLVDLKAGKVLKKFDIRCGFLLAVWPDSSKFAMSHCYSDDEENDRQIRIFDLNTGKLKRTITVPSHLLPSHLSDNTPSSEAGAQIFRLNCLPDVPLITSYDDEYGTGDQPRIHLWDFKNGRLIRSFPQSTKLKENDIEVGRMWDMDVSHDGSKILAARPDYMRALLWDAKTGKLLWIYQAEEGKGYNGTFSHAAIAADGSFCALGGESYYRGASGGIEGEIQQIHIVDMNGRLIRRFVVHKAPRIESISILNMKITPDCKRIVTTSGLVPGKGASDPGPDDSIGVYDVGTGRELCRYNDGHWVTACDVSSDGKYIVTGNLAGEIKMWPLP